MKSYNDGSPDAVSDVSHEPADDGVGDAESHVGESAEQQDQSESQQRPVSAPWN